MADHTRFELVISSVTGRHVRPLHQWSGASKNIAQGTVQEKKKVKRVSRPDGLELGKAKHAFLRHIAKAHIGSLPFLEKDEGWDRLNSILGGNVWHLVDVYF